MTSRDDMVIVVNLRESQRPDSPSVARAEGTLRRPGTQRRGVFARAARVLGARRAASVAARSITRNVPGLGGAARVVAAGGVAAVVVMIGLIVLRLASGKSFGQLGEELNELALGGIDDEARAGLTVMRKLQSDPNLMAALAGGGAARSQILEAASIMKKRELRHERGASTIRRTLQTQGMLDNLILKGSEAFAETWGKSDGVGTVETIKNAQRRKAGGR